MPLVNTIVLFIGFICVFTGGYFTYKASNIALRSKKKIEEAESVIDEAKNIVPEKVYTFLKPQGEDDMGYLEEISNLCSNVALMNLIEMIKMEIVGNMSSFLRPHHEKESHALRENLCGVQAVQNKLFELQEKYNTLKRGNENGQV